MHFQYLLAVLPVALAQYGGGSYGSSTAAAAPSATSAATSVASGTVQKIKVGLDGALAFEPNTIKADAGALLEFHFYAKNHSVVQSSFSAPYVHPLRPVYSRHGAPSEMLTKSAAVSHWPRALTPSTPASCPPAAPPPTSTSSP